MHKNEKITIIIFSHSNIGSVQAPLWIMVQNDLTA